MAARREDPETGLTGPEEVFCTLVLKSGNASGSYRQAFPRSQKWTQNAVDSKASVLLASEKVQKRMSQLRSDLRQDAKITLAEHLEELLRLREAAKADKQHSAAITAETNRGKVCGLYTEKVALSNPDGSPLFSRIERVVIHDKK